MPVKRLTLLLFTAAGLLFTLILCLSHAPLWSQDEWPFPLKATISTGDEEYVYEKVAFSDDGKLIALSTGPNPDSASEGNRQSVTICDAASLKSIRKIECGAMHIASLAFQPGSSRLAVAAKDRIAIYETQTGELHKLLKGEFTAAPVRFSPDGREIFCASGDKMMQIRTVKWTKITTVSGHQDDISCLCLSPDGKLVVTGSSTPSDAGYGSSHIICRTVQNNALCARFHTSDEVLDMRFIPGTSQIMTAGVKGIFVREAKSLKVISCLEAGVIISAAADSRHHYVAAISVMDPWASMYDFKTWSPLGSCPPSDGHGTMVAFSPDGSTLAAALGTKTFLYSVTDRITTEKTDNR